MKQIIDPTYGRQFRKMRKSKHINLINACGNITSKSSLARWENGADNLSWNQVINLLTYNHIKLAEFIRKSASKNLDELLNPIAVAYNANQVPILKEYATGALNKYNEHPSKKNLFQAAIACNYYQDLSATDLASDTLKEKLTEHFHQIIEDKNIWQYEDIFYFGNTVLLFSPKNLYQIAFNLIDFIQVHNISAKEWYGFALNMVLNADFALIKIDSVRASRLLTNFDELDIKDIYSLTNIRKKFMRCLLEYIQDHSNTSVAKLISYLDFFNMTDLKHDFQVAFDQIKQIYG